jgi:predicted phosphodiesterase
LKLGIFSDVHGNIEALEAVLAFFRSRNVTEYLCLGDIVGYGADPEECVRTVRELHGVIIAGNHDQGAIGKTPVESFSPDARAALAWTRRHLTPFVRFYLDALELTEFLPAYSFRLVHGSPSAPRNWDYVVDWSDVEYEFGFYSERVCFIGHSHVPFAARLEPGDSRAHRIRAQEFELRDDGSKYLMNVGSVGQPRDSDPRACAVIFDPNDHHVSYHRIEYDIATAQRKIINAGLPESLAARLAVGR